MCSHFAVSKEDIIDMDTMPREISKKNNKFSPIAISNGNIPAGGKTIHLFLLKIHRKQAFLFLIVPLV